MKKRSSGSVFHQQVRALTKVLLVKVGGDPEYLTVAVKPATRTKNMNYYLATHHAPLLHMITLEKFGQTFLYFQPLTKKETHG